MAIRRVGVALVVVLVATVAPWPILAAGAGEVRYEPPVDARIIDPFRVPRSRYGPGNRGLTYAPEPGSEVRASAAGSVTFAGSVAGTLHVTVLHADGLRTTYSFLDTVTVRRGERVRQGDVVGRAGPGFHFGVRDGDAYLDPAALFGAVEVRVRLVEHEEPLPPTDAGLLRERLAVTEVVREKGLLGRLTDLGRRGIEIVAAGVHTYRQLDPRPIAAGAIASLGAWISTECTRDGDAPVRPSADVPRVAVLVGGHGSTSQHAAVDDVETAELGYAPGDVVRYSYAGGRVPSTTVAADLARLPARAYTAEHTRTDLRAQGVALADMIEEITRSRPGAPIDLLAHSQGGIVARLALRELDARGRLGALGTVVTLGTPHAGTDLATGSLLVLPHEQRDLETLAGLGGLDIDIDATSVRQMAETSGLITRLRLEGVPDGVDLRTIAATGDVVVTADHASVPGHPAAMVSLLGPTAHDDLPGDARTTRELQLALAGRPPGCRDLVEAVGDAVIPRLVSFTENAAVAGYVI